MKQFKLFAALLTLLYIAKLPAQQVRGSWHATSKNAQSVTGDIAISGDKMEIAFAIFPVSQIRALKPEELKATFDLDGEPAGAGSLYKLNVPATQKFLKKNSLCGDETTQWMVTYVAGRSLEVAFFSGGPVPLFTPEAIATTTNLCGVYSYVK